MSSRPAHASVVPQVSTRLPRLRCLPSVFFLLAGTRLTQADTGTAGKEEKVKPPNRMVSSAFQNISTLVHKRRPAPCTACLGRGCSQHSHYSHWRPASRRPLSKGVSSHIWSSLGKGCFTASLQRLSVHLAVFCSLFFEL